MQHAMSKVPLLHEERLYPRLLAVFFRSSRKVRVVLRKCTSSKRRWHVPLHRAIRYSDHKAPHAFPIGDRDVRVRNRRGNQSENLRSRHNSSPTREQFFAGYEPRAPWKELVPEQRGKLLTCFALQKVFRGKLGTVVNAQPFAGWFLDRLRRQGNRLIDSQNPNKALCFASCPTFFKACFPVPWKAAPFRILRLSHCNNFHSAKNLRQFNSASVDP